MGILSGAFGMTPQGKAYQNWLSGYAGTAGQQAEDWYKRSQQLQNRADPYAQWAYNYYQDILQQGGLPTPGQIHATGAEVIPGIPEAQERRWDRWAQIQAARANVPSGYDVMEQYGNILNERGGIIGRDYSQQQAIIDELTKRGFAREEATSGDIVQNIQDTYGSLENYFNERYGAMAGNVKSTFEDLVRSGEMTYEEALAEVEKLKPGGQFETARVARSYAPMVASAAGRLRRAGVEPGGVQGAGVMARAEAERARGMDEAAARSISEYVAAKTGLGLGRQGMRERLGTGRLAAETGLGREQTGLVAGTREASGQAFRNELVRTLGARQGMDAAQAQASSANLTAQLERNIALLKDKGQAALLSKALQEQDWATMSQIMQGMNQEELTQLGLTGMQFEAGMGYTQGKLGREDQAMAQILGMTAQDYNRAMTAMELARQLGGDAAEIYKQLYGVEAANAGWGTKMLLQTGLGIAKTLLTGGLGGGGNIANLPVGAATSTYGANPNYLPGYADLIRQYGGGARGGR